jgi:hypothetical protein
MSRKEKATARAGRLDTLLASGDHRAAAREARATLADPGASPEQRTRAGAVLGSLAPDPFAVALGILGALVAIALSVWLAAGGAR